MECDVDGLLLRYVNDLEYKRNKYYWSYMYILNNEKVLNILIYQFDCQSLYFLKIKLFFKLYIVINFLKKIKRIKKKLMKDFKKYF